MFTPVFQINNKILSNLIGLEMAAKLVELAPISPDIESRLKTESLAKKIYQDLKFFGNSLNLDEVVKIVKDEPGRDDNASDVAMRTSVVAKEKEVQQVLNWLVTTKMVWQTAYLSAKFKQVDYGERELNKINVLLGERLHVGETLGKFRIEDSDKENGINVPPAVEVTYQMEDIFNWFKSADRYEIHPALKAGVMFFELLRISPFMVENFATAKMYFDLIVSGEGFGFKQMFVFEDEMFKSKEKFMEFYSSGEKGDLTVWLEFVTKSLADSAEKTKVKVLNLVGGAPLFRSEAGRAIPLSERQISIMEEMTVAGEMTLKDVREILPMVSDDTILRDLKGLITKKLIRKKGHTKGAVYVLGKVKNFK